MIGSRAAATGSQRKERSVTEGGSWPEAGAQAGQTGPGKSGRAAQRPLWRGRALPRHQSAALGSPGREKTCDSLRVRTVRIGKTQLQPGARQLQSV